MQTNTIKYIGCFFEPELLKRSLENYERQKLSKEISYPHVTFAYRPEEIPAMLFGQRVTVRAIGYSCNGENEALLVEFVNLPESLKAYTKNIAVPHITLSIAESAKAVNSYKLDFKPIAPFSLVGVFGGMDETGTVRTRLF
ncbi:MAG: hypothetical protein IJB59_14525 [Oscillospiraceae bacterium]|nr:hypothetical protein [Oscillospiraceae bacterium]